MACDSPSCGCDSPLVPLRAGPLSRRSFLKLLGATGVAGLPGCFRPPPSEVAPYVRQPEGFAPGNALHYATALAFEAAVTGVVVTAHEGRPTKIEGNPLHPLSRGATGMWEQAALLELYDPHRLSEIREHEVTLGRDALLVRMAALAKQHDDAKGERLHLLLGPSTSPTLARALDRLRTRFPRAQLHTWRAVDRGAPYRAARMAFGRPLHARPRLDKAEVIVALDADFISFGPERLRLAHEFADRRTDPRTMNRLYALETELSVAGSLADERLAARPSTLPALATALLLRVAQKLGRNDIAARLREPELNEGQRRWLDHAAKDLGDHRGRAVAIAGEAAALPLQLVALALNALVAGDAVELLEPNELDPEAGPLSLQPLLQAISGNAVDALICTAFDPVYAAPAELELGAALARVHDVVQLALYPDETSRFARYAVPRTHPLEAWDDVRAADGTVSIVQPLLLPQYPSFTDAELISALVDAPGKNGHDLLLDTYQRQLTEDFPTQWRAALQDGVVAGSARSPVQVELAWNNVLDALGRPTAQSPQALELHLAPDRKLRDGELAHNPWLQECPDVLTQLAWDNALLLNPSTARRLNLGIGDRVQLTHDGRTLTAPVFTIPGQAEGAVTLHLGGGRVLGANEAPIGVDAYRLRTLRSLGEPQPVTLQKLDGTYDFAQIQIELSDQGRPLSLEVDSAELPDKLKEVAEHRREEPQIYPRWAYPGYRWAMAIDLSRCVACNACVVACRAENNVPVVGRDEVKRGREMHWLRVERYFRGNEDQPQVRYQPLMCVHCENAPCEYVCPVNATVHSDEGLNEMVYNRCVGTRYCSNNCPYKVRRFNFFDYADELPAREYLATNPDVTVRSRGVMEKCSYCVQRIERTRIAKEIAGQPIRDGDIQTACQQACPTEAIVFGSLHEPDARVSVLHDDPRAYHLLGELGTRPRTAYLARLTHKPHEGQR